MSTAARESPAGVEPQHARARLALHTYARGRDSCPTRVQTIFTVMEST